MRGNRKRDRGIMVTKLELTKDMAEILEKRQKKEPLLDNIHTHEWAVFEANDDEFYAICTEGVGPDDLVTAESPLFIDLYQTRRREEDGRKMVEMMASSAWQCYPKDIKERLGEKVDLADFIRQFGSRLETNFWIWHKRLGSV